MEERDQEWGFHAFIRGIILFGFSMLMLSMVMSGSIQYYIAPKMLPFIYFAMIVFLILSVVQILRSTPKAQEEELECDCGTAHQMPGNRGIKVLIYSLFILPLLMGFVLPDKTLDSSVAMKRGVNLGSGVQSNLLADRPAEESDSVSSGTTTRADEYLAKLEEGEPVEHYSVEDLAGRDGFDDYYSKLAQELFEEEIIYIEDDNFLDVMTVLDMYLDEFQGKKVELEGFVYREPGVKTNEMVVARFSMTCCTADSSVYGLLSKGEETKTYENDTWVRVQGSIGRSEFGGWVIPLLQLEQIVEIEPPENQYVYPSFF
ncbi:TIGR03943 family putative permease subunit [Caldalkalibacillus mannanilyticus]|uniref:TIGR03943 family putative permease subunit n=1 Tax=Caldalkalibacillus mannanilyticus TaxID=1418 RepID=UPI0004685B48|nr:TIGR03943 family protein [Caldalkalibacillus mannanilyticus]